MEIYPEHSYPAMEFDLDINYIWEEPNDNFVHHDILRLPDGNYLSIVETTENHHVPNNGPWYWSCISQWGAFICDGDYFPWVGDKLVIWDKDTKAEKWSWSTFDYFNISDYDSSTWSSSTPLDKGYFDWTHVNAFYFDDIDSSIYISTRNLSRITKLKYPSGNIIWDMGLDMVSGDVEFGHDLGFSHQHSISVLENGNILIFDNGKYSDEYWGANPLQSRALEIKISNNNGQYSAEIVWDYVLPPELFGPDAGNVQKLSNGNYLVTSSAPPGTSLEVTTDKV